MHNIINNLVSIQTELKSKLKDFNKVQIIAVSKTFSKEDILPLIKHGHAHYGENKVQESLNKWTDIKIDFPNIKLHMIGKLQTNKVKFVVPLFDYIHSLDNLKLAEKISSEQKKNNKRLKIFIQVNIGDEDQKSGVSLNELETFYHICKNNVDLDIIGLMCIPPKNSKTNLYFSEMQKLKTILNVRDLSMGMSDDYLQAIEYEASFIRIGSKIFGPRN